MIYKERSPGAGGKPKRPEIAVHDENTDQPADSSPMSERKKMRFMKFMVITCIVTLICLFIAAYIAYWHGIDMDTWLTLGCGAFSLELASTTVIKIYQKYDSRIDPEKTDAKTGTHKVNG